MPPIENALPEPEVLYHDGPCWVFLKPAGLGTQAPPPFDSMEARVRQFWKSREGKEGKIYVGVPHRLDRPVSGAVIFARHVRAAARIARQFEHRTVLKQYLAILEGELPENEGVWLDYLRKIPDRAEVESVPADTLGATEAESRFFVIGRRDGKTAVGLLPRTGRMHQLRVQAAQRGFPIWGDFQYQAQTRFGPVGDDPRGRHIALHAARLRFIHPMHPGTVDAQAPLPKTWPDWPEFTNWVENWKIRQTRDRKDRNGEQG